jgi:2-dehydropantoate 2-reductase
MKIGIVGAGAMGSLFAWHLTSAGADVWALDQWQEHVAKINQSGLTVQRHHADALQSHFKAASHAAEIGPCDIVMIFVKYGQTADALAAAHPMIASATTIVTIQNGIGNVELIEHRFPANRVLFGLTTLTSEMIGPGRIEASFSGRGETYLWPIDKTPTADDRALCQLLQVGGVNAMLEAEIELKIWKKLIVNCCLNTICAITSTTVGGVVDAYHSRPLLEGVVREIATVAKAKGIALGASEAIEYLYTVSKDARDHQPSMMIDMKNRRRTEIDCLNGAILRECARLNIAAPFNTALYSIIKILEDKFV